MYGLNRLEDSKLEKNRNHQGPDTNFSVDSWYDQGMDWKAVSLTNFNFNSPLFFYIIPEDWR